MKVLKELVLIRKMKSRLVNQSAILEACQLASCRVDQLIEIEKKKETH